MNFVVKFIVAQSYDFDDKKTGKRVAGTTAHCFDSKTKKLLKVKVVNASAVEGKKFGDDITVVAVPNGNFIRYEV